jgi:uncharacterized damage-inducible protein DinB
MKKADETTEILLHLLAQSYDQKAWHGPNLRSSLRGLTAAEAAWTPGPQRHSIWELALHCAYWKYVVVRKLEGGKRGSFARSPSNFPRLPEPADARAWKEDLSFLDETHRGLLESVRKALSAHARDPGSRARLRRLIEGVASHDVYHAGQIRLLIRLMPAAPRKGGNPLPPASA